MATATLCVCLSDTGGMVYSFRDQHTQTFKFGAEILITPWFALALVLLISSWLTIGCYRGFSDEARCCEGITGNVDGDEYEIIDARDIIALEEFLYHRSERPNCLLEADVNRSLDRNPVNQEDLTYLVDYVFGNGPEPGRCFRT